MRGRKPLPDNVHYLNGNPSKKKLDLDTGVAVETPPCPTWLSKDAKRHWKYISAELVKYSGISRLDQSMLAAYCSTVALFRLAEEKLKDNDDAYIDQTPLGYKAQSVWFQIRNRAIAQLAKLSPEFGLTPSARTRLKYGDNKQLTDDFEDL